MEATSTASRDGESGVGGAPSVVAREALFETLSTAERAGGVTLVSAPAGSGKRLLATWALVRADVPGWWLLPVVVLAATVSSLHRTVVRER